MTAWTPASVQYYNNNNDIGVESFYVATLAHGDTFKSRLSTLFAADVIANQAVAAADSFSASHSSGTVTFSCVGTTSNIKAHVRIYGTM